MNVPEMKRPTRALQGDRVGLNPQQEEVKQVSQRNRTWQDNASEFAALDQGESWTFAILVACSVSKNVGSGSSASIDALGKVSARTFARKASTGDHRVARYLAAWQEAAAEGRVQDASTLTPADALTLTIPDSPWKAKDGGFYNASKSGGQIADVDQIANKAAGDPAYAKRVLDQVTEANIEAAQKSIRESVMREPRIATAADQALEDSHKEFIKNQPIRPEKPYTRRDEQADLLALIVNLRKAQKVMNELASQVRNLPPEVEDQMKVAIREYVSLIRGACDVIELGIDGESFDEQLRDLLDAEAGR